ncbi:P-loop containing nucleoside triphosphate hydrolase protein [Lipomyces tetrasporus]|uniref:ATP-dependent RNA helicase n=1 Tax=Lipomyces tetrasporus TaxID=54092 RepID=A0AAD7QUA5_9ASCO|nr:P-loop containing nucleoside triphosphate hydrolase protein [Lipomyces tetrasporus]KAJ8099857.1 P-loop containing nucleoside triphosphate hydrolase protein [Lipomyces tetrasporus]
MVSFFNEICFRCRIGNGIFSNPVLVTPISWQSTRGYVRRAPRNGFSKQKKYEKSKKLMKYTKPARMLLSKSVIAPSDAQRSRWSHDDFRRQKSVVKEFTERQGTTPYLVGPPNAGGFSVLKSIDYEDRLPLNATVARLSSFESLRLLPIVRNALYGRALRQLDEKRPTAIQALAIKRIMSLPPPTVRLAQQGLLAKEDETDEEYYERRRYRKNLHKMKVKLKSYLLAAETGSGKTLAYLLPLVSMLKEEELQNAPAVWELPERPYIRSVILVPTAELVQQILAVVKDMCHDIKLASAGLSQETTRGVADNIRKKQIDILVATPVPLLKLLHRTDWNILEDCRKIVVDEADSLMDRSFKNETQEILDAPLRLETLVFCSATIPKTFDRTLAKKYPSMERIIAPHLHQVPRRITFSTVDTAARPFFNDKRKALAETLYNLDRSDTDPGKLKRIVVFVNHRESVPGLVEYLNGLKFHAVGVTRDNSLEERSSLMREFIRPTPRLEEVNNLNVVTGAVKTLRVLVTTDIFSRGIDMQSVRTIILYDVPFSSIDLIHRAGRTGRMGRRGRVILLATKGELKPWLRGLATTINRGYALV